MLLILMYTLGTTSAAGSDTCITCEAGYDCLDPSVTPTKCTPGTFSPESLAACLDCPPGTYACVVEVQSKATSLPSLVYPALTIAAIVCNGHFRPAANLTD